MAKNRGLSQRRVPSAQITIENTGTPPASHEIAIGSGVLLCSMNITMQTTRKRR